MEEQIPETWSVHKPAVSSTGGLVASHHYQASEIGAQILREGGNAVDAAVAAGLAIGCVEPWMSGLGGGGQMLIYRASDQSVQCVDFGMHSPRELDPQTYPLVPSADPAGDLFGWPGVVDDRNLRGPSSIAVPGYIAGVAHALDRFGTLSWSAALNPAIELAERGLFVDWYATLKIAAAARDLAQFPESARVYLADGFAPAGEWGGPLPKIALGQLASTLRHLAVKGPDDFYRGELARSIVADVRAGGGSLSLADLAAYEPRIVPAGISSYRDSRIFFAPGLTAGPTLAAALIHLQDHWRPAPAPDADGYSAYAQALFAAYSERLATMGDSDGAREPSCTTHLSVVDRDGNMVALTQTLLSVFGSKVMLPESGILMNNGIMWFDPRPGRPNSIGADKRPLSNMCPTIAVRGDGVRLALGASGGRRIFPAVMQLLSYMLDYRMTVDEAMHSPRIDVSGGQAVTVDTALDSDVIARLAEQFSCTAGTHGVYPALFACPNMVAYNRAAGLSTGGAFVPSPWAKVSAAD